MKQNLVRGRNRERAGPPRDPSFERMRRAFSLRATRGSIPSPQDDRKPNEEGGRKNGWPVSYSLGLWNARAVSSSSFIGLYTHTHYLSITIGTSTFEPFINIKQSKLGFERNLNVSKLDRLFWFFLLKTINYEQMNLT